MRWYRSFKMTIGFALGIFIASLLKLDFPVSAGIIAMLNMLDTKRESAKVAWRRLYASAMGLILALIVFSLFGFQLWVLILFVAFFTPIAFKVNAREGIIVNIVLMSHFLVYKEITWVHIGNEYLLVVIGAVVSLLMNLHMPDRSPRLLEMQTEVEELMRGFILNLGFSIKNLCILDHADYELNKIEKLIKSAKKMAYEYMNNYYIKDNDYYLEYFQMRLQQVRRLKYMEERLLTVIINQNEAVLISEFTERLADQFDLNNDGKKMLNDLQALKETFKTFDLPKTHFELEQKSFLIQYTSDLEEFIAIKTRYVDKHF